MKVDIESGLRIEYNPNQKNCGIVHSPKAKGKILVPQFVEINNVKYVITYISSGSFAGTEIELLEFSEDSKIECFPNFCFYNSYIKKIKIPPSIKNLQNSCFEKLQGLEEIEISPNNPHFQYNNHQFLLGKSKKNIDEFDTLLYARSDIEDAIIPPQIKIIKQHSFGFHMRLKSVKFPEESELKIIENNAFQYSTIQTLFLPANLESVNCFQDVRYLTNIEISPKNEFFSLLDNKYLVKRSSKEDQVYDHLVFASRDVKYVDIPSQIKVICECAFEHCKKMEYVTFEPNSSIKSIQGKSFACISGVKNFIFPSSLEEIGTWTFYLNEDLRNVVFQSQNISIGSLCFHGCKNLLSIRFPKLKEIKLRSDMLACIPADLKIYIKRDSELTEGELLNFINYISYIDDEDS